MFHFKKPVKVELKISNTFAKRCICKQCKGGPINLYYIDNGRLFKNPRFTLNQFEYVRKTITRMCNDVYLSFDPISYKTINQFNFSVNFKGYNPKLHRIRGVVNKDNVTEILSCKCGETQWAFNYRSVNNRKEIIMRQGIKTF